MTAPGSVTFVVLIDWGSVPMTRGDGLVYGPWSDAQAAHTWAESFARSWDYRVRASVTRLREVI